MKITMTPRNLKALRAVALAASPDDSRPVTRTVAIMPTPSWAKTSAKAIAVATDSYRVAWMDLALVNDDAAPENTVLLRSDQLTAAAVIANRFCPRVRPGRRVPTPQEYPVLDTIRNGGNWRLKWGDGGLSFKFVAGTYPSLESIFTGVNVPVKVTNGVTLNPAFLSTLETARKILTSGPLPVTIATQEDTHIKPVVFEMGNEKTGIYRYMLMPIRPTMSSFWWMEKK